MVALLALTGAVTAVHAEVVVTDDAGRIVRLREPAKRIVSLAPHATELLFAAGAGARVVGVSAFSDYPQAARNLPLLSGGVRMDIERILALRPNLAVGWQSGNARADLEKLAAFGIPVFFAEPQRLDAVPDTLIRLGRLAGSDVAAQATAARYRKELSRLRVSYRDRRPVRVFFEIAMQPLMTLSQAHLASDVLALCGGRNVFAGSDLLAPEVSAEAVLLQDPDVILFSDELGTVEDVRDWWRERVALRAVRAKRVYSIPGELVLRQTPRVLQGAQHTCAALDTARASLDAERK
jgi:iron complex transport system substrate-binding protein